MNLQDVHGRERANGFREAGTAHTEVLREIALVREALPWPAPSVVPVKNSISLSRLNFPHHLGRRSGRVSLQTGCLMPG
jgi:hypothetical protein